MRAIPHSRICPNIPCRVCLSVKEEKFDFRPELFFLARGNKMVAQIVSNGGVNQRRGSERVVRLFFVKDTASAAGEKIARESRWWERYKIQGNPCLRSRQSLREWKMTTARKKNYATRTERFSPRNTIETSYFQVQLREIVPPPPPLPSPPNPKDEREENVTRKKKHIFYGSKRDEITGYRWFSCRKISEHSISQLPFFFLIFPIIEYFV